MNEIHINIRGIALDSKIYLYICKHDWFFKFAFSAKLFKNIERNFKFEGNKVNYI